MSMILSKKLQSFVGNRDGNVATLFGLMAIPILGVVGTAIDYGRAASLKSELQALIDGASLAATAEYAKTGSTQKANDRLRAFVAEGLSRDGRSLLPKALPGEQPPALDDDYTKVILTGDQFDKESATIEPKLKTRIPTTVAALLDWNYFEVEAAAKAGLAGKKLELSVMLDITGSMCNSGSSCSSGTKLNAMKDAAKDLVDIIFTGNGANTRVAVVPFSTSVNVGSYAAAATGQPATKQTTYSCYKNGRNRTCTQTEYRTNCVAERNISGNARYEDDAPGSGRYSTALWTTSSNASCAPGNNASVLPLTNTRTAIEAKINGLSASGGTAGHIGTAWAWYTISDKWASFWGSDHAPEPAAPDLLKAAVLMTDGEYNNCQGGTSCSNSSSQALSFCTNMKAQGIRVFTVGFDINNNSARNMLIECASPGDYHFPYSSEQMREAFRSIGNSLVAGTAGPVLSN